MGSLLDRPGNAALRRGRDSTQGARYVVTTVTDARTAIFADFDIARAAAQAIEDPRTLRSSRLWCWVLMPDHLHALLEVGRDDTLARLVQRIKTNAARAANRARGDARRIWQPAYHDRAIRADEDMVAVARYVIANPKRAGLVARTGQYPFWDAAWLGDG